MVSNSNGNTNGKLIEELWDLTPGFKSKTFPLHRDSFKGNTLTVAGQIKKNHYNELLLEVIAKEIIGVERDYMFNVPILEYFSEYNGSSNDVKMLKSYDLVDSAILSTQHKFLTTIYKTQKTGTINRFKLMHIPWENEANMEVHYEIWKPRTKDDKAVLAGYYTNSPNNRSLKAFVELGDKPEYEFDKIYDDSFPNETEKLFGRMNKVVGKYKEYLVKK